jgi:diamine N-acetyltransferase
MESSEPKSQVEERPIINIAGVKVALGPFHRGMLQLLNKWDNDFAVSILSGDPLRPVTKERTEARYERDSKEEHRSMIEFIIYEQATLRPIGLTELRNINYRDSTADFGILIGEKDCWGKGFGTEATSLMLDYGFTILGLHNVMLGTYSYNERAIRAYERAGFRIIGRRREAHRWGNKLYDSVIMECLSTEFHNPNKPILELP